MFFVPHLRYRLGCQPLPVVGHYPRSPVDQTKVAGRYRMIHGAQIPDPRGNSFGQLGLPAIIRIPIMHHYLGGGFKWFLLSPRKLGKISNLTNIFQMGSNHQPVIRIPSRTNQHSMVHVSLVGFVEPLTWCRHFISRCWGVRRSCSNSAQWVAIIFGYLKWRYTPLKTIAYCILWVPIIPNCCRKLFHQQYHNQDTTNLVF